MHPQDVEPLGERLIVHDAHSGIAKSAEILGGKERETANVTEAAGPPPSRVGGANRLRGILNHPQAVPLSSLHQGVHVGDLTIEMHGHQRLDEAARGAMDETSPALLALRLDKLPHGLG